MSAGGRRWLPWAALVAGVAVIVLVIGPTRDEDGPPLDPSSTGELGTRALVLLLREVGADVEIVEGAPTARATTALVLSGGIDPATRAHLRRWVEDGGRVVVASDHDVGLPTAAGVGVAAEDSRLNRRCSVPALDDVDTVDPAESLLLARPDGAVACYRRPDGAALVVLQTLGAGTVVHVGGPWPFVNGVIGHDDNALLATSLLAPRRGTRVEVVRPLPAGGGSRTLWDLVTPDIKAGLAQLGVGFLLLALWRARRLGRPVDEGQPVELAGSDLVGAVGALLEAGRRRDRAAGLLRADLRRRVADRLGLGPDVTAVLLADAAASRTTAPVERMMEVCADRPVAGDTELLALARSVESLYQEVVDAPSS